MRGHIASNENTGSAGASVYHQTRDRMDQVFGARDTRMWPSGEDTCSKCYSVTPAITTTTARTTA
ncbi:hypothetical protein [Streptomyces sp. NBC_01006]|uniref:hypothetical protein n=1 Tax=Streptomyces sp. NBC_01006 TaxID=2903716 RepID=UPI0038656526|nr:hypothetical protein OG509_32575 [Streptomyces sp. NBC_01006]